MPFPTGIGVVDLMLSIPSAHQKRVYDFMRPLFRDAESLSTFDFPVEYMFKDFPRIEGESDYLRYTLNEMDRFGIDKALMGFDPDDPVSRRALREHPDRFLPEVMCKPNLGLEGVRWLARVHEEVGLKAVSCFPSGFHPQVAIDSPKMYPIYAFCVERGLPFVCTAGVPGPRIPMAPQLVEQIDQVCWQFPELRFVLRHGAEPWEELAVKLMLKYPNLYYSTSAFAPKHYPRAIVDYANTRGADKVMYAGYFPAGLKLERIFAELPEVPFRDEVWPKFLRGNALRVFDLEG